MELEGKTLRVYRYLLLKGRPVGVRELQRKLKFKSPSLAHYHLSKLESMGLVTRTSEGKYVVKKVIKLESLRDFLFIKGYMFPKFLFYAVFITIIFTAYLLTINLSTLTTKDVVAIIGLTVSLVFLWYETIRSLLEWRST